MNNYARVVPYLWPSRRTLLLSFVFAGLVALFWGLNLAISFPVVKVLLQGESLHGYVRQQIDECEKTIEGCSIDLERYDEELLSADEAKELSYLRKKARAEAKRTSASSRLALWRWIDVYVMPRVPTDRFQLFALILTALLILTVLKLLCMFAEEVLVGSVVQLTVMRIRKAAFRKVLALDYQTLKLQGTSELMSRFTYDVEALGTGLALLGGKLVREPLKAATCLGLAFWINWRLTLLSVLFVPLAGVIFHRIGRTLKKASQRSMESVARIYKVLEETFEAAKVVIAFDRGRRHRFHHHRESKAYYHKSMNIVVADALTNPATELLGMSAVVLALLPGAYLALRETTVFGGVALASEAMDIAELSMMYAMLVGVLDPLRKLSSVFSKLKRSGAAADRVFELMDRRTLVSEPAVPRPLPRELRTIEFQDVGFAYASTGHSRPIVLDGVTLSVSAGETVAVVGENGSGKSTLVNLLPRLFDVDRGAVLIDEIDIRDCSLRDLRSRIGIVTQETLLLDDTVFENIRYGKPGATPSEVERAAQAARVTQFLDQLPEGFQTRVGERGASLSGGQRQRIALARAILRDPAIFILDEATNAIDSQSERLIHEALEAFVRGRTTFIITHSIGDSILSLVTRIVVLERGRLVADGSHHELLETCPVYRRLYQAQGHEPAPAATRRAAPTGKSGADPGLREVA